jgi:hypothetical protein
MNVTTDRTAGTCHLLITWQGTATTTITVPLPRPGSQAITVRRASIDVVAASQSAEVAVRLPLRWA